MDLREYQTKDIQELEKRENKREISKRSYIINSNIGIYTGEKECGKKRVISQLLSRNNVNWGNDIMIPKITETQFAKITSYVRVYKVNTTLILTSFIITWIKELTLLNVDFICVTDKKSFQKACSDTYEVIVVIPKFYNKLIAKYDSISHSVVWKRFVYDTPEYCIVAMMKKLSFDFMWIVTTNIDTILNIKKSCFYKELINGIYPILKDIVYYSGHKEQKASLILEIQERFDPNLDCIICFDKIEKPMVELGCKNFFCKDCIEKWRKNSNSCPICKRDMNLKLLEN